MKTFKDIKAIFDKKNDAGWYFVHLNKEYSLQVYDNKVEGNIFRNNEAVVKFIFRDNNVEVYRAENGKIIYTKNKKYLYEDRVTNLQDDISPELLSALILYQVD